MTTRIYGSSDDLIEIEGEDVEGEVGFYGTDEDSSAGVLLVCSDGTLLAAKYGKGGRGIWGLTIFEEGSLLSGVETCNDEDADPYSDVATFQDGLTWVIQASEWGYVK
jgi:hypothetical protein